MTGFGNELEADLLDHVFGKATYTAPTNWYVALSTTTPTETGGNFTEPSGDGYARVSTSASDWNTATEGDPSFIDNANSIDFPGATGSWGTITHFGLFDVSTGGTTKMWGAVTDPLPVGSPDTPSFDPGALAIKLGDPGDTY